MATTPAPIKKVSLLDKLEQTVYLSYVLKFLGIVLVTLALFRGWHQLSFLNKTLLVIGPIAFYVGMRFNKIYR